MAKRDQYLHWKPTPSNCCKVCGFYVSAKGCSNCYFTKLDKKEYNSLTVSEQAKFRKEMMQR
jgi:hypothetical protein